MIHSECSTSFNLPILDLALHHTVPLFVTIDSFSFLHNFKGQNQDNIHFFFKGPSSLKNVSNALPKRSCSFSLQLLTL